jgi:tRNA uridine 5-carboxymethylaminomethyl modification enzyme
MGRLNNTREGKDTLAQILKRSETSYETLPQRDESLPEAVARQLEIEIKYAGYIARQSAEVERIRGLDEKGIPSDFDFSLVPSLRLEARQKLDQIRPKTIGQAARISGVSPADISILVIWLRKYKAQSARPENPAADAQ